MRFYFGKCFKAPFVALDCRDISALRQKRAGQSTGTRSHFDDRLVLQIACLTSDFRSQIEIEEKILAERFLRHQVMPFYHFTQRRKIIYAHAQPFAAFSASCCARRTAATRLSGRAMPLPAISKAVP